MFLYPTQFENLLTYYSHGKAYLKITNLHYEIGEQDLKVSFHEKKNTNIVQIINNNKSLFETVGETSFVLIEYNHSGRSSGVAYVGYEDQDNNETAVQKFDKKKAVGEIISVEEIKPLNVLIAPRGTRSGTPRGSRAFRGETRGGHRTKKPSMDELDEELNRYMNKEDDKPKRPVKSNVKHSKPTIEDFDKELDDYMKTDQPFPATGAE